MIYRPTRPATFRPTRTAALVALVMATALAAGCSSNDDDGDGDGDDGMTPPGGNVTPPPGGNVTPPPAPRAGGPLGIPDDGMGGFSEGVVTAANPLAAEAGAQVLRDDGNAIDAAVVVQFVLNVVEPTSSGIGGGGFMGVHLPAENRTFFIDSREKAPARASANQFLVCDPDCGDDLEDERLLSTDDAGEGFSFTEVATSGIGVGVPGTLLGAAHALENYGTLTLAEALAPAIALARDGFEVNERLSTLADSARTEAWPETAAVFRDENGEPIAAGTMLVQTELADTFQLIADNGVDAFYEGPIAEAIVAAQLRSRGQVGEDGAGRMSLTDLTDYRDAGIDEREPVAFDYRGYTINGMPSPSSGGYTTAQILHCMEDFDLGNEEAGFGFGSANALNVMAESMRVAFSSRSVWMGDIDFVELPIDGLLSDGYLDERCATITADARLEDDAIEPGDPRRFDDAFDVPDDVAVNNGVEGPVGLDTTHFTVIDQNGIVVSWTSTIEGTWGAGMIVPGYGFLLNNELTDFNFRPQANDDEADFAPGANDVAPGKRPRSSMAPTLVFEDDVFRAAYGSPGGSTIINSVVNITTNLIDHGMSVADAIDAPRLSVTGRTSSIAYEVRDGQPALDIEALRTLGHSVRDEPTGEIGSVQAVVVDSETGTQYGGADSRRVGTVVGLPDAQ